MECASEKSGFKELKVDVTIDDSIDASTSSIRNAIMFRDWLEKRAAELMALRPLIFVLKELLDIHQLNVPYHGSWLRTSSLGGLGSYALTLMTSAFLKTALPIPTVAHGLLGLLHFYGQEFKSDHMAVVNGEHIVLPQDRPIPCLLLVQDPFRASNNAAASVTRVNEIQELFLATYEKLVTLSEQCGASEPHRPLLEAILVEVRPEHRANVDPHQEAL